MYTKKIEEDLSCGVRVAMKVFGGKWKCCILDAISQGISRPADISRVITDASPRVIEMHLAELLFFGAVEKDTDEVYPKRSEYRLTALGRTILPVIAHLEEWGQTNMEFVKDRQAVLDERMAVGMHAEMD
jgi:DNA-binding HxlR family transcriptional regulator